MLSSRYFHISLHKFLLSIFVVVLRSFALYTFPLSLSFSRIAASCCLLIFCLICCIEFDLASRMATVNNNSSNHLEKTHVFINTLFHLLLILLLCCNFSIHSRFPSNAMRQYHSANYSAFPLCVRFCVCLYDELMSVSVLEFCTEIKVINM